MNSCLILTLILSFWTPQDGPAKVTSAKELQALPLSTKTVIATNLGDEDLLHITRLKHLESLDLSQCFSLSLDGLTSLEACKNLNRLSLSKNLLTNPAIHKTKWVPLIKQVDWSGIQDVKEADVRTLANFIAIEEINFRGCSGLSPYSGTRIDWSGDGIGVNDAAIESLAKLKGLRSLNLENCQSISDRGVTIIAQQFPNLHKLILNGCTLSDKGIAALKPLKEIRELGLSNLYEIKGSHFDVLSELKALRSLDLEWSTKLESPALEVLKSCPKLRVLNLQYCKALDSRALESLIAATSLRELNLFGLKWVQDETAARIAALKFLTKIDIGAPGILTDTGMRHIGTMTNLESLGLQACKQVTLKGIKMLAKIRLKDLNVYYTQSNFDDEDVIALAHQYWPGCRLYLPSGKQKP